MPPINKLGSRGWGHKIVQLFIKIGSHAEWDSVVTKCPTISWPDSK